jgi:peptidyl-tRNA hydrolase, PTH2 family
MEPKQVIGMRRFQNLRTGKYCAQAAHASMKALLNSGSISNDIKEGETTVVFSDPDVILWLSGKFTKICLFVTTEAELLELERKAKEAGLPTGLIQDCGDTEFKGVPTYTALGIGPGNPRTINAITGNLPLF